MGHFIGIRSLWGARRISMFLQGNGSLLNSKSRPLFAHTFTIPLHYPACLCELKYSTDCERGILDYQENSDEIAMAREYLMGIKPLWNARRELM